MTKVTIRHEKTQSKEVEEIVELWPVEDGDTVSLMAGRPGEPGWYVATIDSAGICLIGSLPSDFPLPLDQGHHIKHRVD